MCLMSEMPRRNASLETYKLLFDYRFGYDNKKFFLKEKKKYKLKPKYVHVDNSYL